MNPTDDERKSAAIVAIVDALTPYARTIRDTYMSVVDPSPICGWFPMWCELTRIAENKKHPHQESAAAVVRTIQRLIKAEYKSPVVSA